MVKKWKEKFYKKNSIEIKTLNKSFWGKEIGSKMLIPSPKLIQDYINMSDPGQNLSVEVMRNDLAIENGADFSCPLTSGIFLRVVAEYNHELLSNQQKNICPFWRIIDPNSKLADKLSFGKDFIIMKRQEENI